MPVIVTLDIYSGVPNPTWELSDSQALQLKQQFAKAKAPTQLQSPAASGRLGYRGFHLYATGDPSLPATAHVFDGVLDIRDALSQNYVDANSSIESFLLESGKSNLSLEQHSYVQGEIKKNVKGGLGNMLKAFRLSSAPPYDPGKWNNDPNIMSRNNCYNYANDKITNTFAQPGRGSGSVAPFPPDCNGTGGAAQRDGQIPVPAPSPKPAKGQYIVLVIWPGHDFHWYRQDANGKWSHKPGGTPARNTDNSGKLISDPRKCDRGPYTIYCTYYQSIPSQTHIL